MPIKSYQSIGLKVQIEKLYFCHFFLLHLLICQMVSRQTVPVNCWWTKVCPWLQTSHERTKQIGVLPYGNQHRLKKTFQQRFVNLSKGLVFSFSPKVVAVEISLGVTYNHKDAVSVNCFTQWKPYTIAL